MSKRDEDITKALGLCWHEFYRNPHFLDGGERNWVCKKCPLKTNDYCHVDHGLDFSTADGMLLILQKGPEREEMWREFMVWIGTAFDVDGDGYIEYCIPLDLLQDPDKLANELWEFLEEKK